MLAAALPAADAASLAHHLAQQAYSVIGEREVVAVAAMVGHDHVARRLEVVDHADGVGLLADVRVRRPVDLSGRKQVEQRLLEAAHHHHLLVKTHKRPNRPFGDDLVFACHLPFHHTRLPLLGLAGARHFTAKPKGRPRTRSGSPTS